MDTKLKLEIERCIGFEAGLLECSERINTAIGETLKYIEGLKEDEVYQKGYAESLLSAQEMSLTAVKYAMRELCVIKALYELYNESQSVLQRSLSSTSQASLN